MQTSRTLYDYVSKRKIKCGFRATFTTGLFRNIDWYIDSEASVQFTAREYWLLNQRCPDLPEIIVANKMKLVGKPAVDIEMKLRK